MGKCTPITTKRSSAGSCSDACSTRTLTEYIADENAQKESVQRREIQKKQNEKELIRKAKGREESQRHGDKIQTLRNMRNPPKHRARRDTTDPGVFVGLERGNKKPSTYWGRAFEDLLVHDSEAASSANSCT